jgi:transmembrane sensor
MTPANHIADSDLEPDLQVAADWVARLSGEPGEGDWLAFEAWLCDGSGRRPAYDRALAVWLQMDGLAEHMSDAPAPSPPARRAARGPGLWLSASAMTIVAAAVGFAVLHPAPPSPAQVYATARGEHRAFTLADGTRVALNTGSSITVRLGRTREITVAEGEAAFQVSHNPNRPFVVIAGDRVLRDIGTDFDVQREQGMVTVTVREGMVEVQRPGGERSLSLGPGSRWAHREGSGDSLVTATDTDQVFAWRSGRLIYRDRPLSDIAADLSRYGGERVTAAGPAGALRFSGVLTIDNQQAMVQRLTGLLPVSSSRKDGAIVLRELNTAR